MGVLAEPSFVSFTLQILDHASPDLCPRSLVILAYSKSMEHTARARSLSWDCLTPLDLAGRDPMCYAAPIRET